MGQQGCRRVTEETWDEVYEGGRRHGVEERAGRGSGAGLVL